MWQYEAYITHATVWQSGAYITHANLYNTMHILSNSNPNTEISAFTYTIPSYYYKDLLLGLKIY